MKTIKIMLVDDQTIIRDGLKSLLSVHEDIEVVAAATNGRLACEEAQRCRPDVVLMDIRMPEMDGVEATRIIKQNLPDTVVIVLTTFDDDEYIIKAMTYGASGYLLKDTGSDQLIQAIRDGMAGNIILPGRIAARITAHLSQSHNKTRAVAAAAETAGPDDFSARELDIISLLTQGKSNREIADTLYLSTGTVKNYISQIYLKIGVNDRANAVLFLKNAGF
jgi:DNA-binding NarL/FixJ family response regulator